MIIKLNYLSNMKRIALFLTFCLYFGLTNAQVARLYTSKQGLQTNDCHSVDVDSRGFVWIAGFHSLGVFDGSRFMYLPTRSADGKRNLFQSAYQVNEFTDDKYWFCTSHGLYLFDNRKFQFQRVLFYEDEDSIYGISTNNIIPYKDADNMLVTTDGFSIYILNNKTLKVDNNTTKKLNDCIGDNFAFSPIIDKKNNLWIATKTEKLVCVDLNTYSRKTLKYTPEAEAIRNSVYFNCLQAIGDDILIGTSSGLLLYDKKDDIIRDLGNHLTIQSIIQTKQGKVLLGTDGRGIWEYETKTHSIKQFEYFSPDFETAYGKVIDMSEDKNGNIVAMFLQKGLVIIPQPTGLFHYHPVSPLNNGKNATSITSIAIDKDGNNWIGTDGCGVFKASDTNLSNAQQVGTGIDDALVQSVIVDKHGTVWEGSYDSGVKCLEGNVWKAESWFSELANKRVMALHYFPVEDHLLVGTNGEGVYVIDIANKKVFELNIPIEYNKWVSALFIDSEKTLWIATSSGLVYYNRYNSKQGSMTINGARVCNASAIAQDGNKILVGTDNGLIIYDTKTQKQDIIDDSKGLLGTVKAITNDKEAYWISTSRSISRISKNTLEVTNYTSFNGYDIGEFHRNSFAKNAHGHIVFGGNNGIISFAPERIKKSSHEIGQVVLTYLKTPKNTENLDATIVFAKELDLEYENNSFDISFSTLDYDDPERVHYDYILEGLESDWHKNSIAPLASYTSLPAGNYVFRVRAYYEDSPQFFTEATINVHIDAPWYGSIWAIIFYCLVGCVIIYLVYLLVTNRKRVREQMRRNAEANRMKEAKLRLFTSITHELRSPLTMIESPLRQLISTDKDPEHQNLYAVMIRNCNRLLDIVKQITDIRKIDAGQLKLKLEERDYVEYSNKVFEQFYGVAKVKNITFNIDHASSELPMMMDDTQFEKIITNILSNAFKFTPEGGKIEAKSKVEGNNVVLSFYNSGSKFNEEDIKHIWERFYQGSTKDDIAGSGIGLNLVSELVKLHHGTIEAKNIEPDGVEFTLVFPYFYNQKKVENDDNKPSTMAIRPTILIVDDDTEIISYLGDQLSKEYNVLKALSGNSAWKVVKAQRPDVVITDYNMPDGTGLELVQNIKSNPETDSTPVIMVTGEGDDMLKLHSLNLQVDHYLEKPVNFMLLRSAISQVLRVRENMRNKVHRKVTSDEMPKVVIENAEEKLFARINEAIKKHLDNSEYSVQQLAEDVGISRVHLNRKMKERYGVSPNVFIKSTRLKQAASLLINNKVNVSEVAYSVGFSSHSYFTTAFHEYFGMSPKEFIVFYSEEENKEALRKLLE